MLYAVPLLITAAFSTSRQQFHAIIVFAAMNSLLSAASVAGYIMLKQAHYKGAVAAVHEMCDQRPIRLTPSEMNWAFDLRDDNLPVATDNRPEQPECTVNFDQLMIMKK
jgi:hypothetical protein